MHLQGNTDILTELELPPETLGRAILKATTTCWDGIMLNFKDWVG